MKISYVITRHKIKSLIIKSINIYNSRAQKFNVRETFNGLLHFGALLYIKCFATEDSYAP